LPKRKQSDRETHRPSAAEVESTPAAVRSFWSGTITFGLVSIPVELLSAVRPRQTAMKLIDKSGHPLGRQYHCSKENKKLSNDELVRGYETDSGKIIEITDEEFESVAPEMSGDIELRNFVPLEQIPPMYFQKPYFLAPSGKSAKAYHLLAATMERTGRVGIGSFVMRGHEYLVAIVSDNGVLRADTLRYADEIRQPEAIGLPKQSKVSAKKVDEFAKEIDELARDTLDVAELEDKEAEALQELVKAKQKDPDNVIHQTGLEEADADAPAAGAKVIDLMAVLRKSLSKNAVVTNALGSSGGTSSRSTSEGSVPIDLAERRAQKQKGTAKSAPKKSTAKKAKKTSARKAPRKRARRA
jgi:DNA end-binding protein Ku